MLHSSLHARLIAGLWAASVAVLAVACRSEAPGPKAGAAQEEFSDAPEHGCVQAPAAGTTWKQEAQACAAISPPAGGDHFGSPFALTTSVPLSTAVASSFAEDVIQVEGAIDAVCQKRGCWMVLREGNARARVLMKDHAFAVPIESRGKRAIVEGILERRTFSEAQARHLERDAGRDAASVTGPREELVLIASGVMISGS